MIILHVPHASRDIPNGVEFLIDDIEEELDRMTDHYTDELFNAADAVMCRFPVSRLVVDPERFPDDDPMDMKGQGAVYTHTSQGELLKSVTDRQELLDRYYWPHHQRLEGLVERALARHGKALIIDCHSFPDKPLPVDLNQDPARPDICIGTDPYHTPQWLIESLQSSFKDFDVKINEPYSGTMVPMRYYKKDSGVMSVMVEINRRLYLTDEPYDVSRSDRFEQIQKLIRQMVETTSLSIGES